MCCSKRQPNILPTTRMICTSAVSVAIKKQLRTLFCDNKYMHTVQALDKFNSSTELKTLHAFLEVTVHFNSRIHVAGYGVGI